MNNPEQKPKACPKFPVLPCVMALLSLLAALGAVFLLARGTIQPHRGLWLWLLLFLPAVVFAGTALSVRCRVFSERAGNWITGLLILPLAAGGFFLCVLFLMQTALTEVTEPVYYERVLAVNGYPENPYLAPFPEHIPPDAEDVSFRYLPQFLQGGSEFYLSYRVSEKEQRTETEALCKNAVWRGTAEEYRREFPETFSLPHEPENADAVLYLLAQDREHIFAQNHGKVCLLWLVPDGTTVWYASAW